MRERLTPHPPNNPTSEMGQKRRFERRSATSALPPKADNSRAALTDAMGQEETFEITCNDQFLPVSGFSASATQHRIGAAATAPVGRRNLEGRFVLYLERHRARDK